MLDPANAQRYAAFAALVEAIDTDVVAALYARLYPLFQEQYRLLGYPHGHFNDRVVQAIDDLLDAPNVAGLIRLAQPRTMYVFADEELERLSAGQKAMIRIGPENAALIKAKLRELRAVLTSGSSAATR